MKGARLHLVEWGRHCLDQEKRDFGKGVRIKVIEIKLKKGSWTDKAYLTLPQLSALLYAALGDCNCFLYSSFDTTRQ